MRDIVIARLNITDLQGLENIGTFGNELSIEQNSQLLTLRQLGSNLPDNYRTVIRNIGIRNNERLADVEGLRFIQRVDGELVASVMINLVSLQTGSPDQKLSAKTGPSCNVFSACMVLVT